MTAGKHQCKSRWFSVGGERDPFGKCISMSLWKVLNVLSLVLALLSWFQVITNVDVQSIEPIDQNMQDSLSKSVQMAIEIATK